VDAIGQRDIPVITGGIVIATMIASILMLIIDILYVFIDPRIKVRYTG
jgi:peptide/nickel transport system permease protein